MTAVDSAWKCDWMNCWNIWDINYTPKPPSLLNAFSLSVTLPFSHSHPFTLAGVILTLSDNCALKSVSQLAEIQQSPHHITPSPPLSPNGHLYTHSSPLMSTPFLKSMRGLGEKVKCVVLNVLKPWCVTTSSAWWWRLMCQMHFHVTHFHQPSCSPCTFITGSWKGQNSWHGNCCWHIMSYLEMCFKIIRMRGLVSHWLVMTEFRHGQQHQSARTVEHLVVIW